MGGRYAQCDGSCTVDCGHCKGHGPPPAPLIGGAIGRGLVDAVAAYKARLSRLLDPDPLEPTEEDDGLLWDRNTSW